MAKKQEWTVRVVNPVGDQTFKGLRPRLDGTWVECLRYVGVLRVLQPYDGKVTDGFEVIEINAPHGVDSQIWARQNAERMASFGIDAVAAPKWGG
jgi:hypothetical protein